MHETEEIKKKTRKWFDDENTPNLNRMNQM